MRRIVLGWGTGGFNQGGAAGGFSAGAGAVFEPGVFDTASTGAYVGYGVWGGDGAGDLSGVEPASERDCAAECVEERRLCGRGKRGSE